MSSLAVSTTTTTYHSLFFFFSFFIYVCGRVLIPRRLERGGIYVSVCVCTRSERTGQVHYQPETTASSVLQKWAWIFFFPLFFFLLPWSSVLPLSVCVLYSKWERYGIRWRSRPLKKDCGWGGTKMVRGGQCKYVERINNYDFPLDMYGFKVRLARAWPGRSGRMFVKMCMLYHVQTF